MGSAGQSARLSRQTIVSQTPAKRGTLPGRRREAPVRGPRKPGERCSRDVDLPVGIRFLGHVRPVQVAGAARSGRHFHPSPHVPLRSSGSGRRGPGPAPGLAARVPGGIRPAGVRARVAEGRQPPDRAAPRGTRGREVHLLADGELQRQRRPVERGHRAHRARGRAVPGAADPDPGLDAARPVGPRTAGRPVRRGQRVGQDAALHGRQGAGRQPGRGDPDHRGRTGRAARGERLDDGVGAALLRRAGSRPPARRPPGGDGPAGPPAGGCAPARAGRPDREDRAAERRGGPRGGRAPAARRGKRRGHRPRRPREPAVTARHGPGHVSPLHPSGRRAGRALHGRRGDAAPGRRAGAVHGGPRRAGDEGAAGHVQAGRLPVREPDRRRVPT